MKAVIFISLCFSPFLALSFRTEFQALVYCCQFYFQVSANPVHFEPNREDAVVESGDLGSLRGFLSKTRNTGRPFLQFRGIPYALPPIGDRRFMPSELLPGPLTQDGTPFNATGFGSPCPQTEVGDEDCLFLNIATGNVKGQALVPVIVYIHGAAFVKGNANKFDGQLLLKEDLVVVSFNYRLGIFGYFGISTDFAPGNGALYDALTVLKWVHQYIHHFGGDPKLVTIAGQSSGAASATHLLLSPLSKGLFHRAIALSGTALNDWAITANSWRGVLRLASLTGCYNSSVLDNLATSRLQEIISCMKLASQQKLIAAQERYQLEERKEGRHGFNGLTPLITFHSLKTVPTLLPDFPVNILKRKQQMDVPLMLGATKQDGEFALGLMYFYRLVPNGLLNNATFLIHDFVPTMMAALGFHPGSAETNERFVKTYLERCSESGNFTEMLPGFTDISTVLFFKAAALQMTQLHSQLNSTYLYSFDFKGTRTQHHPKLPFPGGVAHSDDTIYLFPVQDFNFNEEETKVSNNWINIWANFARTGSPVSETMDVIWPPFDPNHNYLIIDSNLIVDDDYQGKWIGASRNAFGNSSCYKN